MRLSNCLSDAVLSVSAFFAAYTLHHDVAAHSLPTPSTPPDEFTPSLITSLLPLPFHLHSLTSLISWGFFFLSLASAAGTLRFSGALPLLTLPLHQALTHIATLLSLPSFALAVWWLPVQGVGGKAGPMGLGSAALPGAALFTSLLSALLFFPLLCRHLPRAVSLTTSSQAISACATAILLLTALSRVVSSPSTTSSAPYVLLLVGSVPLLVSSAVVGRVMWGGRVDGVDVFHYGMALTCCVWLVAFRQLFSVGSASSGGGNRVDVFYLTFHCGTPRIALPTRPTSTPHCSAMRRSGRMQ